jgi:hypothetical protein
LALLGYTPLLFTCLKKYSSKKEYDPGLYKHVNYAYDKLIKKVFKISWDYPFKFRFVKFINVQKLEFVEYRVECNAQYLSSLICMYFNK